MHAMKFVLKSDTLKLPIPILEKKTNYITDVLPQIISGKSNFVQLQIEWNDLTIQYESLNMYNYLLAPYII